MRHKLCQISHKECEDQHMTDVSAIDPAGDVQSWVQDAATPVRPGQGVGAQIRKATEGLFGRVYSDTEYNQVRAAWYGKAGSWSARKYLDFKHRYERWKARQDRLTDMMAETTRLRLEALERAASNGTDPDFLETHLHVPRQTPRDSG